MKISFVCNACYEIFVSSLLLTDYDDKNQAYFAIL